MFTLQEIKDKFNLKPIAEGFYALAILNLGREFFGNIGFVIYKSIDKKQLEIDMDGLDKLCLFGKIPDYKLQPTEYDFIIYVKDLEKGIIEQLATSKIHTQAITISMTPNEDNDVVVGISELV